METWYWNLVSINMNHIYIGHSLYMHLLYDLYNIETLYLSTWNGSKINIFFMVLGPQQQSQDTTVSSFHTSWPCDDGIHGRVGVRCFGPWGQGWILLLTKTLTIGPMFTLFTYVSVEVPYCKGCNHLRSPKLHKTLQRVFLKTSA